MNEGRQYRVKFEIIKWVRMGKQSEVVSDVNLVTLSFLLNSSVFCRLKQVIVINKIDGIP